MPLAFVHAHAPVDPIAILRYGWTDDGTGAFLSPENSASRFGKPAYGGEAAASRLFRALQALDNESVQESAHIVDAARG